MSIITKLFGNYSAKEIKRITPIQKRVLELESKYEKMSDSELREQTDVLKDRLQMGESLDTILPDAFAVCREASWRVLGMKHFPVQVLGGIILHPVSYTHLDVYKRQILYDNYRGIERRFYVNSI